MDLLSLARRVKHRLLIAKKRLRPHAVRVRDQLYRRRSAGSDFVLTSERYLDPRGYYPFDYFLDRPARPDLVAPAPLSPPRVLYLFWTGSNPMSEVRRDSIRRIREVNSDLEVCLVTAENLEEHLIAGEPLHPAYHGLSTNHRSDYLRCYFMHHVGGAYSDIKAPLEPWSPVWDRFDDPDVWLVGQPEVNSDLVANLHGKLRHDIQRNFSRLALNASFVMRPRTPLTAEWYEELLRRMDYYARDLDRFPATDPMGTQDGYRVTWIGLQAQVFHPLQLKYLNHVRLDPRLTVDLSRYR